ncbi:MAG: NAD-dependent epimerase/dehydratase family protein [Deltaproteobacteria bacterium]|nr:NAD-dependent epimerase/dehydratase family protein [Deltaproteobacteria bacterium]
MAAEPKAGAGFRPLHVVVAGCGWLGLAVAKALLAQGHRVTGIRRDPTRAAELAGQGIQPLALNLLDPQAHLALPPDTTAIVACQAAGGGGLQDYRAAYLGINQTLLRAAERLPLRALVYTSSTGVFGHSDGSQVDETTEPSPRTATGEVLAEAEQLLRSAATQGVPTRIVRLSGLYGPGRWGTLQRVRSGALALGPGDGAYMNFCHLDDAVQVVLAALDRGSDGTVYHASDAHPPLRREVVTWLSAQLGIAPSRTDTAIAGPSRRVSSAWTLANLGITLRYPDFRSGFAQALAP